jgi:hypothetical protein
VYQNFIMLTLLREIRFKIIFCLFLLIITLNCKKENTHEQKLFSILKQEVDLYFEDSNNVMILIFSDKDCTPCLEEYRELNPNQKVLGLFYSKYKNDFRTRLEKINPSIHWEYIKDKKIITYLKEWDKNGNGPYTFKLMNNKIYYLKK